ncbi:MAG: hypothetical protein ABL859_03625 [Methylotenera sp.]|uniref:hypothetical protein n=1 Tax=Methylotenera sp. TaxID=2051956 RepID=UPI0025F55C86|nr:hypothetical protein [Methylotenera sp.]
MRNLTIKFAVIGALGLATAQVLAAPAGFVNLPLTGFTVAPITTGIAQQPGGTSAFILLNTSGNFGSSATINPATGNAYTFGAILPAPANDLASPATGFTLVTSAVRQVTVNNTYTGNVAKNIGTVLDAVWRNAAKTECIYGTKVTLNSTDYNVLPGNDYFEVNSIVRGGFGTRPVAVAYATTSATGEVTFRAGRTYTSVQHRGSLLYNSATGKGYVPRPLTTPAFTGAINGLDTLPNPATDNPTAAQQSASINTNWVELTTDVNWLDADTMTPAASSHMNYIHSTCSSAAPVAVANAIRLRQTYQEASAAGNPNRFTSVSVTGFVPPGGTATPAPAVPY